MSTPGAVKTLSSGGWPMPGACGRATVRATGAMWRSAPSSCAASPTCRPTSLGLQVGGARWEQPRTASKQPCNDVACSAEKKLAWWYQPKSMLPAPSASLISVGWRSCGLSYCSSPRACGSKYPLVSLFAVTGLIQFNLLPTQSHGNLLLFGLTTAVVVSSMAFSAALQPVASEPAPAHLWLRCRPHALPCGALAHHCCLWPAASAGACLPHCITVA